MRTKSEIDRHKRTFSVFSLWYSHQHADDEAAVSGKSGRWAVEKTMVELSIGGTKHHRAALSGRYRDALQLTDAVQSRPSRVRDRQSSEKSNGFRNAAEAAKTWDGVDEKTLHKAAGWRSERSRARSRAGEDYHSPERATQRSGDVQRMRS